MRPSVSAVFFPFSIQFEGSVAWMYLDVIGLVTTSIGVLIDPSAFATACEWRTPSGALATKPQVLAEWAKVKAMQCGQGRGACTWKPAGRKCLSHLGHTAARYETSLRLDEAGVVNAAAAKVRSFEHELFIRFPEWDTWPACAQLATMSMAWACGAGFRFPKLADALRKRDFLTASKECAIQNLGAPILMHPTDRPTRNSANRKLYLNAAFCERNPSASDLVEWKRELTQDDVDTCRAIKKTPAV